MPTPARRDGSVASPSLSETQARLLSYLRDRVDGTAYLKAKYVAEELDLSSKEVGINMGILADRADDVTIEQWGRSSSTTWKVSARE
ncbi:DUF7123 family protein [Halosimplex halophilum]|uniref:DUF7123 family protein n=1 Tax=Halosimplex halophilum TaxID=2559572 RepID=UPI00107FBC45|nr:hypothetical protein [Halosimplex halophilum]